MKAQIFTKYFSHKFLTIKLQNFDHQKLEWFYFNKNLFYFVRLNRLTFIFNMYLNAKFQPVGS